MGIGVKELKQINEMQDEIYSPNKDKVRRLSGRKYSPIKRHERKRSHTLGHKMDMTMMSDIEYLNFFPD